MHNMVVIEKVKIKLKDGVLGVDVPTYSLIIELIDDPKDDPKHKDKDGKPNKIAKPIKLGDKVSIIVPDDEVCCGSRR